MMKGLFNKMRRWIGMIFSRNKQIEEIVKTQVDQQHYDLIDKWKAIYAGNYEPFSKDSYTTVNGVKTRKRQSLNLAKVSTQKLAKLVFSEKVKISFNDETFEENIKELLKQNRFYKVFQGKVEKMFALGGLILKANPKLKPDGEYKLIISYVTPDCFIPITYENDEISEGVFLTITKKGDKTYCLFEFHQWKNVEVEGELQRVLEIKNELYEEDKTTANNNLTQAKKVPLDTLYEDLEERVIIEDLTQPLFQYIKPNIANNFDLQSPLGISIFANAIDTLNAIDVAFDSFMREFKLGKRRIIVPSAAVRTAIDPETGLSHRYFDADDEVYEAMNFSDPEKQKPVDATVGLRVNEHVDAINALLKLYGMQIGVTPNTFTFDGTGIKTATEIVSENSETYQTKQINEQVLEEGLTKFFHTLGEVAYLYDIFEMPKENYEIEFYWDDSVIKDRESDSNFYIKLKNAGLMPGYKTLMKILDLTEEDAKEWIKETQEEARSANPDLDKLLGGEE